MDTRHKIEAVSLYKAIDVWQRLDESAVARYRCFQALSTGKYCVQSKDYYPLPLHSEAVRQLERQFLELFSEIAPDERDKSYDSLEEAIMAHDQDFADA